VVGVPDADKVGVAAGEAAAGKTKGAEQWTKIMKNRVNIANGATLAT